MVNGQYNDDHQRSHYIEIIQIKALSYGHPFSSNLKISLYYIIRGLRISTVYTILGFQHWTSMGMEEIEILK